jgi:hypothetical protein
VVYNLYNIYDDVSYIDEGEEKEVDKLKTCKLNQPNLHVFSLSSSFFSPCTYIRNIIVYIVYVIPHITSVYI